MPLRLFRRAHVVSFFFVSISFVPWFRDHHFTRHSTLFRIVYFRYYCHSTIIIVLFLNGFTFFLAFFTSLRRVMISFPESYSTLKRPSSFEVFCFFFSLLLLSLEVWIENESKNYFLSFIGAGSQSRHTVATEREVANAEGAMPSTSHT